MFGSRNEFCFSSLSGLPFSSTDRLDTPRDEMHFAGSKWKKYGVDEAKKEGPGPCNQFKLLIGREIQNLMETYRSSLQPLTQCWNPFIRWLKDGHPAIQQFN